MEKAIHIHINNEVEKPFLVYNPVSKRVWVRDLKYSHLNGCTKGEVEYQKFEDIRTGKKRKKVQKPYLSLQTSSYETSSLKKINGKLVFNSYRDFDDEALRKFNDINNKIKCLQKELREYLDSRFMELPFLSFDVIKIPDNRVEDVRKAIKDCGVE